MQAKLKKKRCTLILSKMHVPFLTLYMQLFVELSFSVKHLLRRSRGKNCLSEKVL